jgi:hypothetical protein
LPFESENGGGFRIQGKLKHAPPCDNILFLII